MATSALSRFEDVFPTLAADLREVCVEQYKLPLQVWEWLEKSLHHNALGGKCNRGLSVIDTASLLLSRPLTPAEYFETATLGWLIELLQAMMLVLDDIMDASHTRRGKPCWYRVREVGMIAVNDATVLESAIYVLLKKYFRTHARYVDMVEMMHEVALKIELGQMYDMLVAPQQGLDGEGSGASTPTSTESRGGKVNFELFTPETYDGIVAYKTAYYSFHLPVALALLYTDLATPYNLEQSERVLLAMGNYFQAQDDYLDCHADPEVLGKVGTDIVDGKASWLAVQAIGRCDARQKAVMEENYGKGGACETRVKALYRELGMEKVWTAHEEHTVGELKMLIAGVGEGEGLKREVFEVFLGKIYKRSK